MRKHGSKLLCAGLLMVAALALQATPARARKGSSDNVEMESTGVDADARGRAKLRVSDPSNGRFELRVRSLEQQATYEVVVEGVKVGEITTSTAGAGRIRFRTRPRNRRDQFLGFDPRGAVVAVRDADGHDVLAVSLPDASIPDGDIICCVPDDDGAECEDRTPEECAAQGGTVSGATSCLPNPCSDTPTEDEGDLICCIPDDSGTECEDRTAAECAAQGGIAVSATSCADNPCAAVPPADDDIRCCFATSYYPECEDRTPAECATQGGVNIGAGVCSPTACGEIATPSVRVRCEVRSDRSKISVDGSGLADGSYTARATSGANQATSGSQTAVGGEAEFDFDSDAGDIGAGATPIAANFIQGNQVVGAILDAQGNVLAEASATCDVR